MRARADPPVPGSALWFVLRARTPGRELHTSFDGRFRLEIMKHRGPGCWCLSQNLLCSWGFPRAASGKKKKNKKTAGQHRKCKRCGFDPWVRKIPWRRACNILQYSCLENPHGQRSLAGYSPKGRKEWDTTNVTYLACSIFPDSTYMLIYSICF